MDILYSHRTRAADGQLVHIRALSDALRERGHAIVMAGPDDDATVSRPLDALAGGPSARARLPGPVYEALEFAYSAKGYRRLSQKAQTHRPDIIYERYNLFYHAGVWLKHRRGLPLLLEVNAPLVDERDRHGGLALRSLARRSENAIWRAADMVLPVTRVLADAVRRAGVPDEKIAVIQNGVSADFLQPVDPQLIRRRYNIDDCLVLGFSGFVRDWHGVDRVLRFLADAGRSDLHFLLVGDGPARAELEQLARNLGVADRITMTGVVQRDAMAAHIAAMDIALQPAVTDYASPLKLFEYMALGKPIIAPARANITEIVTHGEDALLFAPEDNKAFFNAMQDLCANAELRNRLGAAARETVLREDYSWAGNAARVERIAERILETGR